MGGRDGYIGYYEGTQAASFYLEFGGGDVVVLIHVGEPSAWTKQFPWAADRREEILKRVVQETLRQRAPTCKADIDPKGSYIYLREEKQDG